MTTPRTFIIVGAGPAGIAAREELLRQKVSPENITVLEREAHVGGKCKTYYDPLHPELKSDYGAHWVVSNYFHVITAIIEHQIKTETVLPNHAEGIPINTALAKKTALEKLLLIPKIATHLLKFSQHAARYQALRYSPTPEFIKDFYLPFSEFAKKYHLEEMIPLLKPVVPGFGYGAMEEIPAHLVFSYMGRTIPLELVAGRVEMGHSMLAIQGGFQHFIEKIAEKHPVITSAKITRIERHSTHVQVDYATRDGLHHTQTADALIIATSPLQWPKLGMKLTDLERGCVEHLEYSRYPVGIVRITGMNPEQYFFEKGLDHENFTKNLGEIAFISTRDNREGHATERLCTVFQNLPRRNNKSLPVDETKEREHFIKKLHELAAKQGWKVELLDYKVWDDYMPALPAKQSYALERAQMDLRTRTLICNSCLPGGFEDVEMAFQQATRAVREHIFHQRYSQPGNVITGAAFRFLMRAAAPVTEVKTDGPSLRSRL